MGILDSIERFGETLYRDKVYRILLLITLLMWTHYTALWCHEFMHYIYATAILHCDAYVQYGFGHIWGWCMINNCNMTPQESLIEAAIGGLGTAAMFSIYWFYMASFPHKLTLPMDLSLMSVVVYQFLYGIDETLTLGLNHWEWYWIGKFIAILLTLIIVAKLYYHRLIEYLKGDVDVVLSC